MCMYTESATFDEASKESKWVEAIQAEINALQDNNTWDLVELLKLKSPIGCRWIYKIKFKYNVEVKRFKARLVAKGYG